MCIRDSFHGDEVVYASLGEGSTSQGEFWEAMSTASNKKLPVVFCVEEDVYKRQLESLCTRIRVPAQLQHGCNRLRPIRWACDH